jgi:gamma-glutamylcyclotransferase (GGCT)/AIG2-like uncharacterized protein YtfP
MTSPQKPIIRVCVYGTLKRGGWNHDRYMTGYVSVEETVIRGRLRWLSPGIPMLEVPPEDILAVGTTNYLADAALQAKLTAEATGQPPRPEPPGAWDLVTAEVFTFDDPGTRLPPLDRLEGFRPGGRSMYSRVLVESSGRPFWIYATPSVELFPTEQKRIGDDADATDRHRRSGENR